MQTNKITKMLGQFSYNKHNAKRVVVSNKVFLESRNGKDLVGNIYAILKYMSATYPDYTYILSYQPEYKQHIQSVLQYLKVPNLKLVKYQSVSYYKHLSTAKYLVTDVTFPANFHKKPEQIYLNTWHGVPLKKMGRQSPDSRMIMGNIQHNFMQADIILHPNEYTKDIMDKAYSISELSAALQVVQPSPRIDLLQPETRKLENWNLGTTYIYLPTWREHPVKPIQEVLKGIDEACPENITVWAKLHPLDTESIDWNTLSKVKSAPEYELYDLLSRTDGLITDYSSVFFDFAYTGKPIVLYQYDKAEYELYRGININQEELGLPRTDNPEQVFQLLHDNTPYEEFQEKYCPNCVTVGNSKTKSLVDLWLNYTPASRSNPFKSPYTLVYGGNLNKNGITTALINYVNYLSQTRKVILTVPQNRTKNNGYVLDELNENVIYYPIAGRGIYTFSQFIRYAFLMVTKKLTTTTAKMYEQKAKEYQDCYFTRLPLDNIVQFTGYSPERIMLYGNMSAKNKVIYVHNDMVEEVKTKKVLSSSLLNYAYAQYDKVVMVSEAMREPTSHFAKKNNLYVAQNIMDFDKMLNKGSQPIHFDTTTESNYTEQDFIQFLAGNDINFVTMGRYAKEKNHSTLIQAFAKLQEQNPNKHLGLTIIGGYGELYQKTLEEAKQVPNIVCIKDIVNPHPILKACDCFILPSDYEAQPLVLYEAMTQGLPVMVSDIPSSRKVIEQIGGWVIGKTVHSFTEGMQLFLDGYENTRLLDITTYNDKVYQQIEQTLFTSNSSK
jgi:CDP-glycerol glycerophosphotransferase